MYRCGYLVYSTVSKQSREIMMSVLWFKKAGMM
jgi:hypothetical protein